MGPGLNLNTWSGLLRMFAWMRMSPSVLWDKTWSYLRNASQILVKCMTKRGRPEEWNQQLQPFNMSQWTLRKGNACHLEVIGLQPPWGNSENAALQASDGWGTCQGHNFNEPWLLHLPMDRGALNFLRCCLLGLKFNISKSTCIKWTLIQEEQRKTNLNIWKAVINGRHSQKDSSDTAIRRVIVPFPTRLWNGLLTTGNCIQQE